MKETYLKSLDKILKEFKKGIVKIDVQRLTGEQMEAMGIFGYIPEGEVRIVAMGKDEGGEVLHAKTMEDVDEYRFLHGEDEYFDSVLSKAKEMFNFRK